MDHKQVAVIKALETKKQTLTLQVEAGLLGCAALPQPLKPRDVLAQFGVSAPARHESLIAQAKRYLDFGLLLPWFQSETVFTEKRELRYRISVDHALKNALDHYRPPGPRIESPQQLLERLRQQIVACLEDADVRNRKDWNVHYANKLALIQGLQQLLREITQFQSGLPTELNLHPGQSVKRREDAPEPSQIGTERVNGI